MKSKTPTPRTVLALDPGLDATGWAVFVFDRLPATLQDAVAGLQDAGQIETSLPDGDGRRLGRLANGLLDIVSHRTPNVAYVELPATEGPYDGTRRRVYGVNRLHMALGALLVALDLMEIPSHGLRALRTPKAQRHELLHHAAAMTGVTLPQGPRGGAREDAWDAVWLGASAVLEYGRRDLEFSAKGES